MQTSATGIAIAAHNFGLACPNESPALDLGSTTEQKIETLITQMTKGKPSRIVLKATYVGLAPASTVIDAR